MSEAAQFLAPRETRRHARRGAAEGRAAINAVSPERKPGRSDVRDAHERLVDLLCSLRHWAEDHPDENVSFGNALKSSEAHFLVERGMLAENHRAMFLRGGVDEPTSEMNPHET